MVVWLLLIMIAGFVVVLRPDLGRLAGFEPTDTALLAGGFAVIVLIGILLVRNELTQARRGVRGIVGLGALALALTTAYLHRPQIEELVRRAGGEVGVTPELEAQSATGEKSVRIRRRPNGHFVAKVQINGTALNMMVDTGATSVVLKQADAKAVGIDVNRLAYTVPVKTANGATFAAPIRIRGIAIGQIGFNSVEALVAQPGALDQSLLGMSFLSRLRSYEFAGEFLTLRS